MSPMHGKVVGYARLCDKHKDHGVLYPCESYSIETLENIESMNKAWQRNLGDPEWIASQRAKGVPDHAIAIFQILAGVEVDPS